MRYKTRVSLDGRTFIVIFYGDGKPRGINERLTLHKGHPVFERMADVAYWNAKHHRVGGPKTIISRILATAMTKP